MFDSVYKEGVCSEQGKHKEIMETFLYELIWVNKEVLNDVILLMKWLFV